MVYTSTNWWFLLLVDTTSIHQLMIMTNTCMIWCWWILHDSVAAEDSNCWRTCKKKLPKEMEDSEKKFRRLQRADAAIAAIFLVYSENNMWHVSHERCMKGVKRVVNENKSGFNVFPKPGICSLFHLWIYFLSSGFFVLEHWVFTINFFKIKLFYWVLKRRNYTKSKFYKYFNFLNNCGHINLI